MYYSSGGQSAHVEIVYTDFFLAKAKGVLNEEDFRELELQLLEWPERGDIVQGTGGVRKMRFALPGRGKSGSVRIFYLFVDKDGTIYLLHVFKKNVQANLTKAQRNDLREVARAIKQEG